jgi:hypothetical protein
VQWLIPAVQASACLDCFDVVWANIDGVSIPCAIAILYFHYVHRLCSELMGTSHALWCKWCLNRSVMCCCTVSYPTAPTPKTSDTQNYFWVGRHDFCAESRTAAATLSLPPPPAALNPGFGGLRGYPRSEADHTLPGVNLGIDKHARQMGPRLGSSGQSYASLGIFGPSINLHYWQVKGSNAEATRGSRPLN